MSTGTRVITPFGIVGRIIETRSATFAGRRVLKHRVSVTGRGDRFWFFQHQLSPIR